MSYRDEWRAGVQIHKSHMPNVFECHSTNCHHKAQQFIQFLHYKSTDLTPAFIIGYCKKHAKSDHYMTWRWTNSGWVFKFMTRDEVLVNEVMKS
jgi:hypothetical protein